ncbi:MAG: peptidylprolyl isomerase [Chlorobi bacterium]|nr:peptidylprolyl isomerase [Chlorobiota bacterium]
MKSIRLVLLSTLVLCCGLSLLFSQSGSLPSGEAGERVIPASVSNKELLRVGDESFTVAEIAGAWGRTPGKDLPSFYDLSRDSALDFINLYADFRLKVLEAKDRGLHKRSEFLQEMDRNRDQVALGVGAFGNVSGEGYLFQRKLVDPGVDRIWERRNDEVRIAIIFSQMDPNNPADTLRAYNRSVDMLGRLKNGEDFHLMATDSTDDPQLKATGRQFGWITGGMMPRDLEDSAFETPPGEIAPDVIRLPAGYVLLKVMDREKRKKVQIAHIVFDVNKSVDGSDNDAEAKEKAEAAIARIRAGEPFEDVAREMSNDRTSAQHGGHLLSWYTRSLGFESRRGKLSPKFEDSVFALNDREVSGLFRDEICYRIVKRVESVTPTLEEEEKAIRDIYRRFFLEADRNAFIDQALGKHGFRIDPATLEAVLMSVDTNRSAADSAWAEHITPALQNRPFFYLLGSSWIVGDWIDSVETSPRYRALPLSRTSIIASIKSMIQYQTLKKESESLESEYPDFVRLMGEFHDGALIFELEQAEVYSKVSFDEEEGKEFFNQHRDNYKTPVKLALSEIFVYTEADANSYYERAKSGEDFSMLAKNHTERQGFREKEGKWPMNDSRNSELVRLMLEKQPDPKTGSMLKPFENQNGWSLVRIDEVEESRPKTYEEARGEVMGDFSDWREKMLRKELIASFRKKYPVNINMKALNAALSLP